MNDTTGRGEEAEGGSDDLRAVSHIAGREREDQGVGSGSASYRVPRSAQRGDLALELIHLRAQDEALRVEDLRNCGKDLPANRFVLRFQIDRRDPEHGRSRES